MAKNQAAQGKRYEAETQKILESEGWIVERAINKTLWLGPGRIISVAHDFWNVWDMIAIKGTDIKFVQVTVWESTAPRIKKIINSPVAWNYFNCAIYARMRGSRQCHYRVLESKDGFKWTGQIKMVVKKEKT